MRWQWYRAQTFAFGKKKFCLKGSSESSHLRSHTIHVLTPKDLFKSVSSINFNYSSEVIANMAYSDSSFFHLHFCNLPSYLIPWTNILPSSDCEFLLYTQMHCHSAVRFSFRISARGKSEPADALADNSTPLHAH